MSNRSQLRHCTDKEAVKRARQHLESELVPEFLRRHGPFIGEHLLAMMEAKRQLDDAIRAERAQRRVPLLAHSRGVKT